MLNAGYPLLEGSGLNFDYNLGGLKYCCPTLERVMEYVGPKLAALRNQTDAPARCWYADSTPMDDFTYTAEGETPIVAICELFVLVVDHERNIIDTKSYNHSFGRD